jgi:glycosyltransferase involved in cell wall biosynthesis
MLELDMVRVKVFWYHPQLRDYRKPLFDKMHKRYDITFFFSEKSAIITNYHIVYSNRNESSRKRMLLWSDICALYHGIKKSDVFLSSFLILNYTIIGIVIAKLFNKKVVIWEEYWHKGKAMREKLKHQVKTMLAVLCDAFFVMGPPQENMLLQMHVPKEKIFRANEYPGHIFHKVAQKKVDALQFLEGKKVILYLGRFIELKGIDDLLYAFKNVQSIDSDAYLLIVGYGPLETDLEELSRCLGLSNVFFYGPVFNPAEKAYILMRVANVLVVPSFIGKDGCHEGGPMVILEALSAGCPVVGTDLLGNAVQFILNDVNGYVVPSRDPASLAKALMKSLALSDTRFSSHRVIDVFSKVKNHQFQFEVLTKAIAFALR